VVHQALVERFGVEQVFYDLVSLRPARDYPAEIRDALERAEVLLVLIGPNWLQDADGNRPLQRDGDWVRREIARSLQRGIAVLPLLLDDATLPTATDLPPADIADLTRRQAVRIRHGSQAADIQRLLGVLATLAPDPPRPTRDADHADQAARSLARGEPGRFGRRRLWFTAAALAAVIAAVLAVVQLTGDRRGAGESHPASSPPSPSSTSGSPAASPTAASVVERKVEGLLPLMGGRQNGRWKWLGIGGGGITDEFCGQTPPAYRADVIKTRSYKSYENDGYRSPRHTSSPAKPPSSCVE